MMSLSSVVYAYPVLKCMQVFQLLDPRTYRRFEEAPKSIHSDKVLSVIKKVLSREMDSRSLYREWIEEMIDDLPRGIRDLDALLQTRFRVIAYEQPTSQVSSCGTDSDTESYIGRFYLLISPKITKEGVESLPWQAAHEVCHILEGDQVTRSVFKAIGSLLTVAATRSYLGWDFVPSLGASMGASALIHTWYSHTIEHRADRFANRHSTACEKRAAISFFKSLQENEETGILRRLVIGAVRCLSHPSYATRIKNIEVAIKRDKIKECRELLYQGLPGVLRG